MKKRRNICYISRNNVRATSEWFNKLIAERPGIVERSEVNPDDNPFLEQQVKSVKADNINKKSVRDPALREPKSV